MFEDDTLPANEAATSEDVLTIDGIVAATYDSISSAGPHGFGRLRALMLSGARLMPMVRVSDGSIAVASHTVDEFVAIAQRALEKEGFFEREISRRVERFGNVAHVFSTYESRRAPTDAAPFARGINSIQLVFQYGRWWVVSILWQDEALGEKIPAEYLTATSRRAAR